MHRLQPLTEQSSTVRSVTPHVSYWRSSSGPTCLGAGGVAGSAEDVTEGRALRPVDGGFAFRAVPVEAMCGSPGMVETALVLADAAAECCGGAVGPVAGDAEDTIGEVAAWSAVSTGAVAEGAMDDAMLRAVTDSWRAASHPRASRNAAASPNRTTRGTTDLSNSLEGCGTAT